MGKRKYGTNFASPVLDRLKTKVSEVPERSAGVQASLSLRDGREALERNTFQTDHLESL